MTRPSCDAPRGSSLTARQRAALERILAAADTGRSILPREVDREALRSLLQQLAGGR